MCFRTIIPISAAENTIQHKQKLVMMGSCFTENIGERLQNAKFSVDLNPFGILYNPFSIRQSIARLIQPEPFSEKELFQYEGRWHSFMHHSRFSDTDLDSCLQGLNTRLEQSAKQLQSADYLLITFGTAWVYELVQTGQVVSNCHKLPEKTFNRRRLTVDEIVQVYQPLISALLAQNAKLKLIFTVSPIRHWKDGAHENNVSKSILLLAIDALQKQFESVSYFPAYELMMDELRDYRFYTDDMLHPNKTAIDYIWTQFSNCYFTTETKQVVTEMEKLTKLLQHRPFNATGKVYNQFCAQQLNKIKHFELAYPDINFEAEKKHFTC
ncbi:MAG: GSCFA domain-containing protein [Paludibacteraceae bacterium]|nr:GSCFA domain-containing protein [Paludibacteraceae bacterium]